MPFLAVALISFASCADQDSPDPNELRTDRSPIVFGDARDVEQSRGQWRHAQNGGSNPVRRMRLQQTALATRATASLHVPGWGLKDQGCIPGTVAGSALLTSSTRMLTARHVVAGRTGLVEARFESSIPYPAGLGSHSGDIVAYDDTLLPPYPHDRLYPYLTKSLADQESPFLQNRLYQLGLEDIQLSARNMLRGPWEFDVEEEDFQALSDSNHILDVALLEVQPRDFEFSTVPPPGFPELELETGGFPLDAPGVFFDYIPFASSLLLHCPEQREPDGSCPVDEELITSALPKPVGESYLPNPLWALHHNVFPGEPDDDEARPLTVNLVSNPYPYVATGDPTLPEKGVRHLVNEPANLQGELAHVPGMQFCSGDGSVETFTYGDLILTTLDAFEGASGGALFHSLRFTRPTRDGPGKVHEHRYAIAPTGVAAAITGTDIGDLLTGWRDPVRDNLDHLVAFSMVSPYLAASSRRDPTTPVQPPDDPEPPACVNFDDDRNCIEYESSLSTATVFPDVPDLEPFVMQGAHDPDAEGFPNPDGTEADHENQNPRRLVQCGVSHYPFGNSDDVRTNAGLGVGFIGSLQYNPDHPDPTADEGSVVGILRMVCTPWSSVPFVRNWSFLQTIGTSATNSKRSTALVPNSFRTLAHSLATIAEWRHDANDPEDAYLRPLSMKTCPPNYFLRGVDFHVRPHPDDANRAILAGITHLRCQRSRRPHRNQQIPDRVVVELYDPADSCSMELGFSCFSLGQQIGWSRPPSVPQCEDENDSHCRDHIECEDPGEAVSGFYYQRGSDGFISEFALDCMRAPI